MEKELLTVDGNEACALSAYKFSELAAIYPITPSSNMAEKIEQWSSEGKENIFGNIVNITQMQSEAGAAGLMHGALQTGSLATTFTASQGLLLMIPNIYKMSGEFLPGVLHVAARSIATRALSIFGDHQDIYATRQTGAILLSSSNVQEAHDLGALSHLISINFSSPIIHFFDGFRTSHEIQQIESLNFENISKLIDQESLIKFRKNALNPHSNPIARGGAENDDIYFQGRESQNEHFENIKENVSSLFKSFSKSCKRNYEPFSYYGDLNAKKIIIAMGSICETIEEVVDFLNQNNEHVGVIKVSLYRPFLTSYLKNKIPKTVEKIAVLDRTKEDGAVGEPLYIDVVSSLHNSFNGIIIGGRYGLSSKDTRPEYISAVFKELDSKNPKNPFTIGIVDDLTNLSLQPCECDIHNLHYNALFYGLGGDGSVSANKNSIKLISENSTYYKYFQAYFAYDSKKSGSLTRSHLRFSNQKIKSRYYINKADFLSSSVEDYFFKYDLISHLKENATLLLNCCLTSEELINKMTPKQKKELAIKNISFYIIDANKIAKNLGLGIRTNIILQSAFLKLNPKLLPYSEAKNKLIALIKQRYQKSPQNIIDANIESINSSNLLEQIKVEQSWKDLNDFSCTKQTCQLNYYNEFVKPINELKGNQIPTSVFKKYNIQDGSLPSNISTMEKRNIASEIPFFKKENCIQCNKCVFVCPHSAIRSYLLNEEEVENSPNYIKENITKAQGQAGKENLSYYLQVSPSDCVGCSLCENVCPGFKGEKALVMKDNKDVANIEESRDYCYQNVTYKKDYYPTNSVKGIGFAKPYFEVSGACPGCGETPYYRLLSQIFGEDLLIANATGCSSIYSASTPSTPFVCDANKKGIAWANSLFEDNAEFGLGFKMSENIKRTQILNLINQEIENVDSKLKELLILYLENFNNRDFIKGIYDELIFEIENSKNEKIKKILDLKDHIINKSTWIIGGDGWAYDIGFGGLDHVLASGENVNILVLDTEVYSNTGGQSSKSTPRSGIAKFNYKGKEKAKKDLAAIAITYKDVYVAQINMGANNQQTLRALFEADSHKGVSIIIAYSPCIEHQIKGGLVNHQTSQLLATKCGYFPIFRYNPNSPSKMNLDFKSFDFDLYEEYLLTQGRFYNLLKEDEKRAKDLFLQSRNDAIRRIYFLNKFVEEEK